MFSLMDKVPSGIEPMLKDLEDHIMNAGLADMVASAETITTVRGATCAHTHTHTHTHTLSHTHAFSQQAIKKIYSNKLRDTSLNDLCACARTGL